mgnify:CR=1 FL=1|jgi:peptide-methionine (S)-S-oxide reductase
MNVLSSKIRMPSQQEALRGRDTPMMVSSLHFVNEHPIKPPFPENIEKIIFGLGCFWGAERKFWQVEGVYSTAVGYTAGFTPNANYEEVCTGSTGHNEVVLVMFDPLKVSLESLLEIFWTSHNPTQGMRQGNDTGTQYRSGVYTYSDQQLEIAEKYKQLYAAKLSEAGHGAITTEVMPAPEFYYAEDFHQQYLAKNPRGYCGLGGLGVEF